RWSRSEEASATLRGKDKRERPAGRRAFFHPSIVGGCPAQRSAARPPLICTYEPSRMPARSVCCTVRRLPSSMRTVMRWVVPCCTLFWIALPATAPPTAPAAAAMFWLPLLPPVLSEISWPATAPTMPPSTAPVALGTFCPRATASTRVTVTHSLQTLLP